MVKVLVIRQDEPLWVLLRNSAWFNDKKIFQGIDEHTYELVDYDDAEEIAELRLKRAKNG